MAHLPTLEEDEWSPKYLKGADVRVLRGDSWFANQDYARCAFRDGFGPHVRTSHYGFRLVSPSI